jgi:hypothetical protein
MLDTWHADIRAVSRTTPWSVFFAGFGSLLRIVKILFSVKEAHLESVDLFDGLLRIP